jgi:hypothetical protein
VSTVMSNPLPVIVYQTAVEPGFVEQNGASVEEELVLSPRSLKGPVAQSSVIALTQIVGGNLRPDRSCGGDKDHDEDPQKNEVGYRVCVVELEACSLHFQPPKTF